MQVCGQGQDYGFRRTVHDPHTSLFTHDQHNYACGSLLSAVFDLSSLFSFPSFSLFFFNSHLFSSSKEHLISDDA